MMRYLEGASLEIVENDLPLGKFIPNKEVVYKILLQNFGDKFSALKEIIHQHKEIGTIPCCYSCPKSEERFQWWSSINEKCTKHLQLIRTAEESIINISVTVPEEYILTVKHVLPLEVLKRTNFADMDNSERFSVIKMNILQLKDVSRQCLVETQFLRPEKQSHKNSVQKFKEITCRICKIISSNNCQTLRPKLHRVTPAGFVIKESCPELARLSRCERINFLKKNNICRSCLSLGINTPSHPGESCDYLVQKRLLFLKCPGNECRLRSTLCDKLVCHPLKHPTDRVLCVPRAQQCIVDTENGNKRETLAVSCDDRAPSAAHYDAEPKSAVVNKHEEEKKNYETHVVLKTTTNMESETLNEKAIKTVGDNKPDSNRSASLLSIGEADGEINHSDHAVKGRGTRSGKMIRRRSLVVKREQHYGTSNSSIVISTNTLTSNYQDINSASGMREVKELRLCTKIFKVLVYKGISTLLDTGQYLF